MKRVVKFFLDSSLELEELDSPPLVHSRTAITEVAPTVPEVHPVTHVAALRYFGHNSLLRTSFWAIYTCWKAYEILYKILKKS
jgi:hypothetical protein